MDKRTSIRRALSVTVLLPVVVGIGAAVADGYTDKHLSRSKRLIELESAYDQGYYNGRRGSDKVIVVQPGAPVPDLSRSGSGAAPGSTGPASSTGAPVAGDYPYGGPGSPGANEKLDRAQQILEEAQDKMAAAEAHQNTLRVDPERVMNDQVAVHFKGASLMEIVRAMAPTGWRVDQDIAESRLLDNRYNYTVSAPRQQAYQELLTPLGLRAKFFFGMVDDDNKPSPLLLVEGGTKEAR